MRPTPSDTVCDPACGTGGFLLWAHAHAAQDAEDLPPEQRDHLRDGFVHGVELVDGTARLAAMNLLLHGIGQPDGASLVARDKANLDITWLRDESLDDLDNLPAPEVIAREIAEDLTAALAEFEAVAAALGSASADGGPGTDEVS